MKNHSWLVILPFLLISCSNTPLASVTQPIITEISYSNDTPSSKPITTPPYTPTETITPTVTITPTPIPTPTNTFTPSLTPTSIEDLSFYSVADCIPQDTLYQRATVTNVIDGDTVEVLFQDGTSATVRYIGIDAPENDFPFFAEAMQANSSLVADKQIVLVKDSSETDQYGRLLRYVIVDDIFINLEMVRSGHAKAVNYLPDTSCSKTFADAESAAREAFAGMWVATATPGASTAQVIIVQVNKKEEWVEIKNMGTADLDLAGWNLVSERGHQECPLAGVIKVGETLRIWAMAAQGAGFSCGYSTNIWNNSEPDPAVLYDAQGVEVSRK